VVDPLKHWRVEEQKPQPSVFLQDGHLPKASLEEVEEVEEGKKVVSANLDFGIEEIKNTHPQFSTHRY